MCKRKYALQSKIIEAVDDMQVPALHMRGILTYIIARFCKRECFNASRAFSHSFLNEHQIPPSGNSSSS